MFDSARGVAIAAILGAVMGAARADDHRAVRVTPLPQHAQECGSCHLAYPPGLLPAASWQRVMNSLDHHFGTDASLDPAAAKPIAAWLAANAGTSKRGREVPPQDRITRSAWFVREHGEVAPAVWQRPAVKSAANCAACHVQADEGDFNEHTVRIPR